MLKALLLISILLSMSGQGLLAAEEDGESSKSSAYVSLGDSMILNLSTDSQRLTFLQLKADVLISDADAEDIIETHIPAIRHKLIVLLSDQKAIDMKTASKREQIRLMATAQIRAMIEELSGSSAVSDVLFSSFLVQ